MWGGGDTFGDGGGGGGGGFMSSSQGGGRGSLDTSAGGSRGEKGKTQRSNNVVPVTCKQVLECQEDCIRIVDTEAHVLTIVGLVVAVEQSATKLSIHMDDQTGVMECVRYFGTDSGGDDAPFVPLEGTYGRVVGALRIMKDGKYLVIFKYLPIMDLNELTAHLLEVIQVEMKLTKLKEQEDQKVGISSNFNNSLSNSMIANNFGGATGGAAAPANKPGHHPNKPDHNLILSILQNCQSDSGLHKDEILKHVKGKLNMKQVEKILEDLSGEGQIYSTIDDDHFNSTD